MLGPTMKKRKSRPDVTVAYNITRSPLGYLLVGVSDGGVCMVRVHDSIAALMAIVQQEQGDYGYEHNVYRTAPAVTAIREYFDGKRQGFNDIPLDLKGTRFQKSVWERLRNIPYGETVSYADVAEDIGSPLAVRAVGTACGANPALLMVPCHRVLSKHGIGGFGCGLDRKRYLLALEEEHCEHRKQRSFAELLEPELAPRH